MSHTTFLFSVNLLGNGHIIAFGVPTFWNGLPDDVETLDCFT